MTETKLRRIAWLSASDPEKRFDGLMHHFNEESLAACFNELDGTKAVGIDGVTKAQYKDQLDTNLEDLVKRMKRMAYRPQPIRQVRIPKEGAGDAYRELGVSVLEDKIVQKQMQKVLESIYEPLFLECSYGFRPGRSCHDAIGALHKHLYRHNAQVVLDVDLANFFGTIDQKRLVEILQEKIGDKRLIRYLIRMLKAGMLSDGELLVSDEGVVQGSICSPILANIYAHYVIDSWFSTTVKQHCRGQVELFRYADDAVICCQYADDAQRVRKALSNRLSKYGLALNEEKTQRVRFCKYGHNRGDKAGHFDFLGFTFYQGRSRKGHVIPKLKTSGKRRRSKLRKIREWAKRERNAIPLKQIWTLFRSKLRGHIQYYGVTFNSRALKGFIYQAQRIVFRELNRRSQRKSFTWEQFAKFRQANPLPLITLQHALY